MSFQLGKGMFVFFFRMWFRKVYVHRFGPLPEGVPVILACTHPNSAVDYIFAPFANDSPTYVLVRGDVFEKKLLNAFFRYMYMLPVYRFRDGFSALSRNEHSFRECYKQFDKNQHLLIFSEGNCVQEKKLQPIQKGTARLALDYLHKHGGKSIFVVPMANNYTTFRQFRSSVMVNFGEAIDASKFSELYGINPNHAYEAFTAEIATALRQTFIHVNNYHDSSDLERMLRVIRAARKLEQGGWILPDSRPFVEEKHLTDWYNETDGNEVPEGLSTRLKSLPEGPDLESFLAEERAKLTYIMHVLVLAPIVLAGLATVILPFILGRWIIKTKIKDIIFENSVTTYGGMVFYYLQTALILSIALALFGTMGWLVVPAIFMTSLLAIEVVDDFLLARNKLKYSSLKSEISALYEEISALTKRKEASL